MLYIFIHFYCTDIFETLSDNKEIEKDNLDSKFKTELETLYEMVRKCHVHMETLVKGDFVGIQEALDLKKIEDVKDILKKIDTKNADEVKIIVEKLKKIEEIKQNLKKMEMNSYWKDDGVWTTEYKILEKCEDAIIHFKKYLEYYSAKELELFDIESNYKKLRTILKTRHEVTKIIFDHIENLLYKDELKNYKPESKLDKNIGEIDSI